MFDQYRRLPRESRNGADLLLNHFDAEDDACGDARPHVVDGGVDVEDDVAAAALWNSSMVCPLWTLSRVVSEMLTVEKYESVMHLVSNVKGTLRDDLDALSAYLATMNMGTLSGAPKIEAMKIIRQLEATKRGYYGGAVLYLTVDGQIAAELRHHDSVRVRKSARHLRVLRPPQRTYFEVLRNKLRWGEQ